MLTPKPYCKNPDKIKAFVLGCDPTAFDKNGKQLGFDYVFKLERVDDNPYFAGILKNLEIVGLSLDNIYVQNLINEYQEKETSENENWDQIATGFIPSRIAEFNSIDLKCQIPVFLTSERLYKVLLKVDQKPLIANEVYQQKIIPVPSHKNKLGRLLISLYRHFVYKLYHWPEYAEKIKVILKNLHPHKLHPSLKISTVKIRKIYQE